MVFKIGDDPRAQTGGDNGRIEDGVYPARLVQLIDIGEQPQEDLKTGEVKGFARELWMTFEFPTERIEVDGEDRPRWQSRQVKLSFNKRSNLTKYLKALDPKGKSKTIEELLGATCQVEIGSTSTGKAKIVNVSSLMKGMQVGELENPTKSFDMDNPDMEVFEGLPDFLKEKMQNARNYPNSKLAEIQDNGDSNDKEEDFDDDLPFDDD